MKPNPKLLKSFNMLVYYGTSGYSYVIRRVEHYLYP